MTSRNSRSLDRRIAKLEAQAERADAPRLPEPLQRISPGGRLFKFVLFDELKSLIDVFHRLEQNEANAAADAARLVQEIGDRAEARHSLPRRLGEAIDRDTSPTSPWSIDLEIDVVRKALTRDLGRFGFHPADLSLLTIDDLAILNGMEVAGSGRGFSLVNNRHLVTYPREEAELMVAKIFVAGQPLDLDDLLDISRGGEAAR